MFLFLVLDKFRQSSCVCRWSFLAAPHDNATACPSVNSLHTRLGYMSHPMGYSGYNTFAPVTAACTMTSYHPSDVIYGAAAAAGVAPLRPPATPPAAHSQTQRQLLGPMITPDDDVSGMCSSSLHDPGTVRNASVPDQLDGIAMEGAKRISSISSLRLKAKEHIITPQLQL